VSTESTCDEPCESQINCERQRANTRINYLCPVFTRVLLKTTIKREMYKEYKGLNLPEIDQEILKFWEENNIFQQSIDQRPSDKGWVFYEGPPSANGKPGIHHVMARTVKDMFCRYRTMKGFRVERKAGWDTHGLPVELNVEKELGITKEDIGKSITVDEYNQKCRETVMRFKDMWDDITRKMGYWVNLDDPYITYENDYIESVWSLLKRLYDKRLLYKGYTIQPYSPAAGTGLSSHELNLPGCYKNVKDTTVVAQFRIPKADDSAFLYEGVENGDVYFLAWTTTPWTLPSNTALAVGPKIDYVRVATFNPYTGTPVNLVMAKELVGAWFKPEQAELDMEDYQEGDKKVPYRVTGEFKGSQLAGLTYEQLMPYAQPEEGDAFKVLAGDFVSTEDGTGIVHIAPSFGADDKRVADQNGIGALTLVDKTGKFIDEVSDYAGRYVKDYKGEGEAYENVDVDIAVQLKKENKAFNVQKYEHNYPHCWRTDKPVLYYPLDSWFVRASAAKERMFELNQTINWKPASTGEGRFGKWLENLQDWNLSRSRYWGIPLPIWRTEDGEQEVCIGSIEQLRTEIEKANAKLGLQQETPEDLHRPYIDDVTLVSEDGQPMKRELDLIDVWFDSGSMPYAQWHYPFENEEKFQNNFPADFIAEGVDQTRGWFYTLHAIATMAFDSVAYKNVVSNGLVLDANGDKMSKSKGNVVDPFGTLEQFGADATRWYMISNAQPWDNLKFDTNGVEEVRRKFFGTLYNTYSFFALYANIDKFTYQEQEVALADRPEIDRWIISLLNSLVKDVDADLSDFEPTTAARRIMSFVDEHLSNWYVRLCRRRFWKGDYTEDKISAYQTLYTCLSTVAKLMAPLAPFFSDWLYRNLNEASGKEQAASIHLTDFPAILESAIDKKLEQRMDYAQRISSLVLSLRKKEKLRVRQPLQKILLPVLDDDFRVQVEGVKDLILAEVNIKEIEYLDDASGVIKKKAKPNFKTLGRRLGKDMKAAAGQIAQMGQSEIALLEKSGQFELSINGTDYTLSLEDFEISTEDIPGWMVASDGDLTVALDVTLTPELQAEGMARELVNRIQNIRKNKDFNVTDRILIQVQDHSALKDAVDQFGDYIRTETLADALTLEAQVAGEAIELPDEITVNISVVQA
jgi:isoleucyl-tRNA synthetase